MRLPRSQRTCRLGAAAATLVVTLAAAPAHADQAWQRVGADSHSGVSGLAYEGRTGDGAVRALVVHDNKGAGQQRLSRVVHREGSATVTPLAWDGAEPSDLEAIEAVPGMPDEYLALSSRGIVYRLRVAGSTATVLDYTPLPAIDEGADFESFALAGGDGGLAALWADRGAGPGRPATLYAAPLTFAPWGQPQFGAVSRRAYRAPYPQGEDARHISDLSVTGSGRIIAGSAADEGDDGPFDSAVSYVGRVTVSAAGQVRVTPAASPVVLGTFPGHKVEAVECVPGSAEAVLGTDDENLGGYVRTASFCAT